MEAFFFSKAFVLFYSGKNKKNVYNKQIEERIYKADCIGNTESRKITSNCLSCYSTRLKFHRKELCKAEQLWDPCCKFNCTPFPEEAKENIPLGNFLKETLHPGLERTSVSISRSVSKHREQWKVTFQVQSKYSCKLGSWPLMNCGWFTITRKYRWVYFSK